MSVPNHVAIILDGNGRWAKSKGKPRTYGHMQGAKNVETICRAADAIGIKYLTFYAFSTENWKRPETEVEALMSLLDQYLKKLMKSAVKENMQVHFIGDRSALNEKIQETMGVLEEKTKVCTGLTFTIAINYGSRDEIRRAVQEIAKEAKDGNLAIEDITEAEIAKHLDTRDIPDPDLMIRTSYELRLSNFLMWQLAYAEFYFTEVPWPDFTKEELQKAVDEYEKRHRRFGALEE
ncbi:MAG: isoprenyl transferase [Lachnospiraceae bacterium]|jgi:undecaprenyl diphosphate synthase|nr:isoprenyl transferase [Lachnospiraceae bacterium]MBR1848691.1 isoprenyl transferase [Lachnospiraceae bacterium]MCR5321000.1 isoprenyl transferase [Lachnospiraceae bacterium]